MKKTAQKISTGIATQIGHFFLHLRWHYQLFILSGGFLLGVFLSDEINTSRSFVQFLNVHLLLFGGATAYNSYWDKDEGPIGGLKNPPEMRPWMLPASVILQFIGLLLAFNSGVFYAGIYLLSMFFFWLYSSPNARWKGHPIKSLFAIGISTGFCSVLLGYLAVGNSYLNLHVLTAAAGSALIMLSLYPLSQIYQQAEDRRRGDMTFAVRYGASTVKRFFEISFLSGLLLITGVILLNYFLLGVLFGVTGLVIAFSIHVLLKKLDDDQDDYPKVMKIKYITSLAFVCFLVFAIIIKH